MKILLTNDDGINAPGLKCLAIELLKKGYEIDIFAPEKEHSGASHAITFRSPLKIKKVKLENVEAPSYAVYGTPADCVRAAVHISKKKFDFCFSGINKGYNAATNVLYSGTVSAAVEANLFKIPSIAASTEFTKDPAEFLTCAKFAIELFEKIKDKKEPIVYNLNTPKLEYEKVLGLKVVKVGADVMSVYNIEENDGSYSMTLMGFPKEVIEEPSDTYYLEKGYATLTPLFYDLNNEIEIKKLKEILDEKI